MREQSFHLELINRLNYIQRVINTATVILGGTSGAGGGTGSPPGGFSGVLPQSRVAGDTTESHIVSSGSNANLLYNLNNIRAWLEPARSFFVREQNPAANFLDVSSGSWHFQSGTEPLIYGGGTTPAVTLPSSGSRIDLLTISQSGVLNWTQGTESWTPVPPAVPSSTSGSLPLWEVIFKSSGSAIHNINQGESYIWKDVRPFITWGIAGGGSSAYSLTPQDVGAAGSVGTSGSYSPGDHVHRGVTDLVVNGTPIYGSIPLVGSGITISESSGSILFSASTSGSPVFTWYADGGLSSGSAVDRVFVTPEVYLSIGATFHFKIPQTSGSATVDLLYSINNTSWTSLFSSPVNIPAGNTTWSASTLSTSVPSGAYVRFDIVSSGSDAQSLSANWFVRGGSGGAGGGGGSGNVTYTGSVGSEPSATTGDLYFQTNGVSIERYTGIVWGAWGPIWKLTPPVSGDFAWVNQDTATLSTTNGGVYLHAPATAGNSVNARVKTAPTVPYTITACFIRNTVNAAFSSCGLLFRQSSDGKLHTCGHQASSGYRFNSTKYTDPTHGAGDYTTLGNLYNVGTFWLRISDDNTYRKCYYSFDGYNFIQFDSQSRTDFLTANQVGFFVESVDGGEIAATLISWAEA